jgi:hypothetical protein
VKRRRLTQDVSSVNHRIETVRRCHLHDRPTINYPAVQSISRRDPARGAALRVGEVARTSRLDNASVSQSGSSRVPAGT